jgi:hypothetical protein
MCEVSEDVHPVCTDEQLATMRARGGRWAGYQCKALDSSQVGTYVFLKFGPGCTYEAPPMHAPDGVYGTGWKFRLQGELDLHTGQLRPWRDAPADGAQS